MGRRIQVRWDLTCGPIDRDLIVSLPEGSRFAVNELLPTITEIKSRTLDQLRDAMNNPENWVGLLAHFKYERPCRTTLQLTRTILRMDWCRIPIQRSARKCFLTESVLMCCCLIGETDR